MAGPLKEKLFATTAEDEEEVRDEREVFLRDGRKLIVTDEGNDQLVEIRAESGMLEIRIKLTAEGPILQMESVRLQLKASEAVEIESRRVEITATEQVAVTGAEVKVKGEEDVTVESNGEVRVVGQKIYLN